MLPSQPSPSPVLPLRGEIWRVNFNSPVSEPDPPLGTPQSQLPTTGDEIYKSDRPAVVMNIQSHWNLNLYIVVPITGWYPRFQTNGYFWMVKLPTDTQNGLTKDSAANTFQVKSVSGLRFGRKMGILPAAHVDLISATIAFCIGYVKPKTP